MKKLLLTFGIAACCWTAQAQSAEDSLKRSNERLDSLYLAELEAQHRLPKVLHAEPLYIDLIRDLGARKGEKEWNVGLGLTDNQSFDEYTALVEYEWAPLNRLGLEVELPFALYYPLERGIGQAIPQNRLKSLKLAAQYTFLVSEPHKTSMALGYIHEFSIQPFAQYGQGALSAGQVFNPFLIAARRWSPNFHTLIYTGPQIVQSPSQQSVRAEWQTNLNIHYMISGTRNFIGVEANQVWAPESFGLVLRPQMRVGIADNLLIGIVTGIPLSGRQNERLSTFLRFIYEPGHRQQHKGRE